jgi:hypothetical protein
MLLRKEELVGWVGGTGLMVGCIKPGKLGFGTLRKLLAQKLEYLDRKIFSIFGTVHSCEIPPGREESRKGIKEPAMPRASVSTTAGSTIWFKLRSSNFNIYFEDIDTRNIPERGQVSYPRFLW